MLLATTSITATADSESVLLLHDECLPPQVLGDDPSIHRLATAPQVETPAATQSRAAYLQDLYTDAIVLIGGHLNCLHQIERDERYWRIVIGPWLHHVLPVLFDRWVTLSHALNHHEIDAVLHVARNRHRQAALEIEEAIDEYLSPLWNDWLWYRMSEVMGIDALRVEPDPGDRTIGIQGDASNRNSGTAGFVVRGRRAVKRVTLVSLFLLTRQARVVFADSYLPWTVHARLFARVPHVHLNGLRVAAHRSAVDPALRRWRIWEAEDDRFERFAGSILAELMPGAYLESFSEIVSQVSKTPWPAAPRQIVSFTAHWHNDGAKVWIAESVRRGAMLHIAQHGGHDPLGQLSSFRDHYVDIGDRIWTWGWQDPAVWSRPITSGKVRRGFCFPMSAASGRSATSGVLVLPTSNPRYAYRVLSAPNGAQHRQQIGRDLMILQSLSEVAGLEIACKVPRDHFGWHEETQYQRHIPGLNMIGGSIPLRSILCNFGLFVSTYNATTLMETIVLDVPTIVTFDPQLWAVGRFGESVLAMLADAGIYYPRWEDAVAAIAEIGFDPVDWWSQTPRREASNAFRQLVCNTSDRPVGDVACLLFDE